MSKNIVLIVMDTARKENLSLYEYGEQTTPFLEELSKESVVFENAVSQAPWTLPSHASMFTGQYPSEHGATQESPYLDETDTLASKLSSEGYRTGLFSANAWISPHTGLTQGFDQTSNFFGALPNKFEDGLAKIWKKFNDSDRLRPIADRVVRFGNKIFEMTSDGSHDSYTPQAFDSAKSFIQESEEPYFTFINVLDPHLPYNPPLENLEQFGEYTEKPDICQNSKEYNSGSRSIDEEEWDRVEDMYNAEINYLDSQIEEFYRWLNDNGELEDTLFAICSDHGELLGEHDLYGHEFAVYDHLINVPMLINHPQNEGSVTRDDTVELIDLYHTILDYAGVEDGVAEKRLIFDENYRSNATEDLQFPDTGFAEYSRPIVELEQLRNKAKSTGGTIDENSRYNCRMYAARTTSKKHIENEKIEDEFYRIENDAEELENKIDNLADEDLGERIKAYSRVGSVGSEEQLGTEAIDESIQDRLGDLGYLE